MPPRGTTVSALAALSALTLACGDTRGGDPFGTSAGTNATLTASGGGTDSNGSDSNGSDSNSGGSETDSSGSDSNGSDSATDSGGSASDSNGSDTDGPKFDVGTGADVGAQGCQDPDGECGCNAVDIVFIIDNSGSMSDAQAAIGQAFPQFADAMVDILPPGTSLHVGVTSTEMGYASGGSTTNCTSNSNGMPMDNFYVTPDMQNTGTNGAQGRLYEANGQTYYEVSTDDGVGIDGLKTWFSAAAAIGTGGSNIEMATAPAGWIGDPANDATNAGFIRDEGAVLVVFFLQDEPDQTPLQINGMPAGTFLLDKLAQSKAGCGGTNCIIGGGMINNSCMNETPIGDFLAGMGAPPVAVNFPFLGTPTAADFVAVLKDTLAGVIAQKCDEIPPVG